MKKIVYGICGIGNGHLFRQLPILNHLLNYGHKIIIFTYGTAYEFFNNQFILKLSSEEKDRLKIVKVDVPYFIGNINGLDFIKAAQINDLSMNNNLMAFSIAQDYIGKPDLIISDY